MTDGLKLQLALFGIAGLAGNTGFMMWSGFLPGPPGQWFWSTVGALVLLSVQCLCLMMVVNAMQKEGHAPA